MSITQLPSAPTTLIIAALFPTTAPETLFAYWAQSALLQQWWPQQAELEPQLGGNYHLSWPAMNWHLRGHYTAFEPAQRLAFTWKWDHDPQELREREVSLTFEPVPTGGTRLLLTHGPYDDTPEEQAIRSEHHLTGWQHFLPRLQGVVGDVE